MKAKNVTYEKTEKLMADFVINLNLKAEYKPVQAIKKHFINHYQKHHEGKLEDAVLSKGFIEAPKDFDYDQMENWSK